MPWPERFERGKEDMFKSKLRFQIRHEDFRQRISQVPKLLWYPKFYYYVFILVCSKTWVLILYVDWYVPYE